MKQDIQYWAARSGIRKGSESPAMDIYIIRNRSRRVLLYTFTKTCSSPCALEMDFDHPWSPTFAIFGKDVNPSLARGESKRQ